MPCSYQGMLQPCQLLPCCSTAVEMLTHHKTNLFGFSFSFKSDSHRIIYIYCCLNRCQVSKYNKAMTWRNIQGPIRSQLPSLFAARSYVSCTLLKLYNELANSLPSFSFFGGTSIG